MEPTDGSFIQKEEKKVKKDNKITHLGVSNDDLSVQILARLDGPSYLRAICRDAKSINENFLLPLHFPWRARLNLPAKFRRAMPRDIDELHIITHCENEFHAPFGDFVGPFGFGRYENGQAKGQYSDPGKGNKADGPLTMSLMNNSKVVAAARRSEDPGVIELRVSIQPPPRLIDAAVQAEEPLSPTSMKRMKTSLLANINHDEIASRLPFCWGKSSRNALFNLKALATFDKIDSDCVDKIPCGSESLNDEFDFRKLLEQKSRVSRQKNLAMFCMKKWRVSMKVAGVSSRSTIFPLPNAVDIDETHQPDKTKRKVIRPMLCAAIFPSTIQVGKTVSAETAAELDREGLAYSLGSYDCRFTEKISTPKKDGFGRTKRVEVGRTRLVWTNLIQGDEPFLPSTRNRVNYNSLITGQRVDASNCKRPKEVRVGVRLCGKFVLEEALEDLPVTDNINRKRKHSTRQADSDILAFKQASQCLLIHTEKEVDEAFHISFPKLENSKQDRAENHSVVYIEAGPRPSPYKEIERKDIIASLLKLNQRKPTHKKLKRSAPHDFSLLNNTLTTNKNTIPEPTKKTFPKFGANQIKYILPRFAFLPLEDGLWRIVCVATGNMVRSAVHQALNEASRKNIRRKCTVCWTDDGISVGSVLECFDCGLLAHRKCCHDKGEILGWQGVADKDSKSLLDIPENPRQSKGNDISKMLRSSPSSGTSTSQRLFWRCAVCCHSANFSSDDPIAHKKPRRNAKIPSRFNDGEIRVSSRHLRETESINENANIPGPRCSLCPHSGGAMSPFELDSNGARSDSRQWAHEVCLAWRDIDTSKGLNRNRCPSAYHHCKNMLPLSGVCVLCGTREIKRDQLPSQDRCTSAANKIGLCSGLTRCAARGCFVVFHPMCALLASKLDEMDIGGNPKAFGCTRNLRKAEQVTEIKKSERDEVIETDKKLCNQYTLKLMKLKRTEGTVGSVFGSEKETIIPVAFCGIHNPRRKDMFYGCPPGGELVK